MKCPRCKESVKGADKIKIEGVWYHHHSPVKKKHKNFLNCSVLNVTAEQLLFKALTERAKVK